MKILAYPEKPIFLCYHNKAFPFGIIQANASEDITKWVCSKSVGCVFNPKTSSDKFDLDIIDQWGNLEGVTTRQTFKIRTDMIDVLGIDLPSMLKTVLENGYYIRGVYNEKYIPYKHAYNSYDFIHDFLVIGYDNEFFYSVGYVSDNHFRRYEIPIRNFIDSLCDADKDMIGIEFIGYNKDHVLKPNITWMISELEKHISSKAPVDPNDLHWGLSAIERLRDFFIDEVVNHKRIYIDRRYSKVLYEHEWILTRLIDLLLDDSEKEEHFIYSNANLKRANLIQMLGLKMEITGNVNLLDSVVKNMNEIIGDEKLYIPKLVDLLKTKYRNGLI